MVAKTGPRAQLTMAYDLGHPFPADEIRSLIQETLKSIFSTRPDEKSKDKLEEEKSSQKFDQWVELVVGDILKKLSTQKNQYKYAVTCHITQNVGAPFCSSTSTFWDIATDSYVCESFSTNEIVCNVTVFGFAL